MSTMNVSIRNLNSKINVIHSDLLKIAIGISGALSEQYLPLDMALKAIFQTVDEIESICQHRRLSPADLMPSAQRSYQWLKLLCEKKWLSLHIETLKQLHKAAIQEYRQPLFPNPVINIQLAYNSSLFRCQRKGKQIFIKAHEGFINAPDEIKHALIMATISRSAQYRQKLLTFHRSKEFQLVVFSLEQYKSISRIASHGHAIDLLPVFEKINRQFFKNQISPTHLLWSRGKSIRRLGTFQLETNTITISRIFDDPKAPILALEYVLYHEMLHKFLGLKESNGKRYAHTSEFKKAEANFPNAKQAEQAVQMLVRSL